MCCGLLKPAGLHVHQQQGCAQRCCLGKQTWSSSAISTEGRSRAGESVPRGDDGSPMLIARGHVMADKPEVSGNKVDVSDRV